MEFVRVDGITDSGIVVVYDEGIISNAVFSKLRDALDIMNSSFVDMLSTVVEAYPEGLNSLTYCPMLTEIPSVIALRLIGLHEADVLNHANIEWYTHSLQTRDEVNIPHHQLVIRSETGLNLCMVVVKPDFISTFPLAAVFSELVLEKGNIHYSEDCSVVTLGYNEDYTLSSIDLTTVKQMNSVREFLYNTRGH